VEVDPADIDNDKQHHLGFATCNQNPMSNNVTVFHNTTPPGGQLNFTSTADLPVGNGPMHMAVAKLDQQNPADPRPDIVTVNSDGTLSVLCISPAHNPALRRRSRSRSIRPELFRRSG